MVLKAGSGLSHSLLGCLLPCSLFQMEGPHQTNARCGAKFPAGQESKCTPWLLTRCPHLSIGESRISEAGSDGAPAFDVAHVGDLAEALPDGVVMHDKPAFRSATRQFSMI
jgi:hypothetical protein